MRKEYDFSKAKRGPVVKVPPGKAHLNQLLLSIRQAGKIRRGVLEASRRFELAPPDVLAIRQRLGLSQSDFAALIGVSVATVQNWEQGRRKPEGPARALLKVAEANPEAFLEALTS